MKSEIREELFHIEMLKRKKVQKFLLQNGLTPGQGQARILICLARRERVTQRELADECLLDVTTMSRTIDRLEKQGLIARERDPSCRRAWMISLTEAGRGISDMVKEGFASLDDRLCSGLREEEQEILLELLKKVRQPLSEEEWEMG